MISELPLMFYVTVQSLWYSLRDDERGQDTLEWVLMGGLVALGIVGIGVLWGSALTTMATNVGYCLDFSDSTTCSPGW